MKPSTLRLILSGLFVLSAVCSATAVCESAAEPRVALVIGNGAYTSGPLANPVNDAGDMAAALEHCGFAVTRQLDATRIEMRRAIREFGDRINRGAIGLFYYAGHGIQVDGINYLVPIGAEVYREDEVEDGCLRVSSVLRKMETAGNRLNIIILDACRDNPFGRSFRSSEKGLAKMDAPRGSILAYATGPGSVAADGEGRNGLYTSRLLEHMSEPGLKIEELFKRVRVDVTGASDNRQVPWESSSLTGDFYFVPSRQAVEAQPAAAEAGAAAALEAERERLEAERERLEAEKRLLEERRRLIEERRKIEEEKQRLAELRREVGEEQQAAARVKEQTASLEAIREEKQKLEKQVADLEGRLSNEGQPATSKSGGERLAYAPERNSRPGPAAQGVRRLAIFPWKIDVRGHNDYSVQYRQHLLGKTLRWLEDYNALEISHSFYQHSEMRLYPDIADIEPELSERFGEDAFWQRPSFFSAPEPALEQVRQYARSLGADAVLMHRVTQAGSEGYMRTMDSYLIDVGRDRLVKESASISRKDFGQAEKLTRRLLDRYLEEGEG